MKQIIPNYSYSVSGKTVTLTDFTTLRLDRLHLITNTTTNAIIYNFADSTVATASISGNVITLSVASGSDTDKLQIIYDTLDSDPQYTTPHRPVIYDIDQIAADYAAGKGSRLHIAYNDDFSNGFEGWQYQHDSNNPARNGITLTSEARKGNYALELHTKTTASDGAWTRKGLTLPNNIKKIFYGCYFTLHGVNVNNPGDIAFDLDTQTGTGSGTGTNRYFFSLRYLNYSGGLQQKWQVQTGTATSQSFTDITSGNLTIPWNESMKPMLNYMVVVIDFTNLKYERLIVNGNSFDLSSMSGPTASASLTNFDMGLVSIMRVENRSDASTENIMTVEKPFLAWGF
jgi:hypothetical protein